MFNKKNIKRYTNLSKKVNIFVDLELHQLLTNNFKKLNKN